MKKVFLVISISILVASSIFSMKTPPPRPEKKPSAIRKPATLPAFNKGLEDAFRKLRKDNPIYQKIVKDWFNEPSRKYGMPRWKAFQLGYYGPKSLDNVLQVLNVVFERRVRMQEPVSRKRIAPKMPRKRRPVKPTRAAPPVPTSKTQGKTAIAPSAIRKPATLPAFNRGLEAAFRQLRKTNPIYQKIVKDWFDEPSRKYGMPKWKAFQLGYYAPKSLVNMLQELNAEFDRRVRMQEPVSRKRIAPKMPRKRRPVKPTRAAPPVPISKAQAKARAAIDKILHVKPWEINERDWKQAQIASRKAPGYKGAEIHNMLKFSLFDILISFKKAFLNAIKKWDQEIALLENKKEVLLQDAEKIEKQLDEIERISRLQMTLPRKEGRPTLMYMFQAAKYIENILNKGLLDIDPREWHRALIASKQWPRYFEDKIAEEDNPFARLLLRSLEQGKNYEQVLVEYGLLVTNTIKGIDERIKEIINMKANTNASLRSVQRKLAELQARM